MTDDLTERLRNGRDVPTRVAAAARMEADAETIKRLLYALKRVRTMAENANYRIGRPGASIPIGNIQQGFQDIASEADEAIAKVSAP